MRILIHNQKGGVGKTTTAANLAAALVRGGHAPRVVLADLDPQMHLTAMLGGEPNPGPHPLVQEFGRPDLACTAMPVAGEPGLALFPAGAGQEGAGIGPSDWVIADTAPVWSGQVAALAHWADVVLCPLEPDFLGLSGAGRLLQQMDGCGIGRSRLRFLLCRYVPRLALHRDVRASLAARFGSELLLPVEIRNSVRLAEAGGHGATVFSHAPGSTGCTDHASLARLLATGSLARERSAA